MAPACRESRENGTGSLVPASAVPQRDRAALRTGADRARGRLAGWGSVVRRAPRGPRSSRAQAGRSSGGALVQADTFFSVAVDTTHVTDPCTGHAAADHPTTCELSAAPANHAVTVSGHGSSDGPPAVTPDAYRAAPEADRSAGCRPGTAACGPDARSLRAPSRATQPRCTIRSRADRSPVDRAAPTHASLPPAGFYAACFYGACFYAADGSGAEPCGAVVTPNLATDTCSRARSYAAGCPIRPADHPQTGGDFAPTDIGFHDPRGSARSSVRASTAGADAIGPAHAPRHRRTPTARGGAGQAACGRSPNPSRHPRSLAPAPGGRRGPAGRAEAG